MKLKIGDKVRRSERKGRVVATSGLDNLVIVRWSDESVSPWVSEDSVQQEEKDKEVKETK